MAHDWEYLTLDMQYDTEKYGSILITITSPDGNEKFSKAPSLSQLLNELGGEKWELTGTVETHNIERRGIDYPSSSLIFKRPKFA